MSLTKNDLLLIKEIFHSELESQLELKLESKLGKIHSKLKVHDDRFTQLENSIDSIGRTIVNDLYEMYTPREDFNSLEKRVTIVETKLHQ